MMKKKNFKIFKSLKLNPQNMRVVRVRDKNLITALIVLLVMTNMMKLSSLLPNLSHSSKTLLVNKFPAIINKMKQILMTSIASLNMNLCQTLNQHFKRLKQMTWNSKIYQNPINHLVIFMLLSPSITILTARALHPQLKRMHFQVLQSSFLNRK